MSNQINSIQYSRLEDCSIVKFKANYSQAVESSFPIQGKI